VLGFVLCFAPMLVGCSSRKSADEGKAVATLPPEPVVTYQPTDAQPGQKIEHGELLLSVDDARAKLHVQHHPHKVLQTRKMPGQVEPPTMSEIKDFALSKSDLTVINPGPGEYVHVMEGQRHGYRNLTVGITTRRRAAPPMHTHMGRSPTCS
jgi:hypothetical protein